MSRHPFSPVWVLALAIGAATAQASEPAPGWGPLSYAAPEPGTYELPALGRAADGDVLDTNGRARRLHDLMRDKLVVLSFVYRSCPDLNGCPLANYVLAGVQTRIVQDPTLRERVRLVSMSFDPLRDRPDDMRQLANHLPRGGDWQFLTTDSERQLRPILEAYGQTISTERGADGKSTGALAHVLRVFLVDRNQDIRNIYSSALLHADTIISDLKTLLHEAQTAPARAVDAPAVGNNGAGTKDDGALSGGTTREDVSRLLQFYGNPPLGLPRAEVPADNPMTAEKVALGRKLFFDRRLSRNGTMSCAMCHVPGQGFTSNAITTAVGIEGRTVRRNTPTIYNTAYAQRWFHDARERRLEQQVWGPLLAHNEMGNPSVGVVLDKVAALADYRGRFEAAFDGRGPTMETLGMALASYERTLVSADSRFDRWYFAGQQGAISPAAARGFRLFSGKAGCTQCHTIASGYALFTDHQLHNTGVGYRQTMTRPPGPRRLQVAPDTFITIDPHVAAETGMPMPSDLGRYEITEDPADRWKYKTATLRNIALTAPYMHDGSVATLRDVIELYDGGGVPHELLDPAIRPLGLDETEKEALVSFLETLTGSNVKAIVADALSAPIGDPG